MQKNQMVSYACGLIQNKIMNRSNMQKIPITGLFGHLCIDYDFFQYPFLTVSHLLKALLLIASPTISCRSL